MICPTCSKPVKRNRKYCDYICYGESVSARMQKSMIGNSYTKGRKLNLSKEQRKLLGERLNLNVNQKGLNIPNGEKCKFFNVKGLRIQGRYELHYIVGLITNNKKLPTKPKLIQTPYGVYTPDFEFPEEYIEIKSKYTYVNCLRSIQYKKIKWVRDNIKKVRIIVFRDSDVYSIESNSLLDQVINQL